jgi:hypothetical protein
MPWVANASGLNWFMARLFPLPPRPTARLRGAAHQVNSRLSASVTAMAASPPTASLTASDLVRVTDWLRARAKVPVSSSWAISGAPQNRPMTAGVRVMRMMLSGDTVA